MTEAKLLVALVRALTPAIVHGYRIIQRLHSNISFNSCLLYVLVYLFEDRQQFLTNVKCLKDSFEVNVFLDVTSIITCQNAWLSQY